MSFVPFSQPVAPAAASPDDSSLTLTLLDGPIRPLSVRVAIGASLWGPFRRLFVEGRVGDYRYTISTGTFKAEPLPSGDMRISTTLHLAAPQGIARTVISMTRSRDGHLVQTEADERSSSEMDQQAAEALRNGLSQSAGGFIGRRSFVDGEVFRISREGATTVSGHDQPALTCQVLGRSTYKGRDVVVARCATAHSLAAAGWTGWMRADGTIAIDIETGVVVSSVLDGWIMDAHASWQPPIASISMKAWFSLHDTEQHGMEQMQGTSDRIH